jgi:hypothetical protein
MVKGQNGKKVIGWFNGIQGLNTLKLSMEVPVGEHDPLRGTSRSGCEQDGSDIIHGRLGQGRGVVLELEKL